MKILILGAAGQISKLVASYMLEQTNHELILFARNAESRLKIYQSNNRVTLFSGDFNHTELLQKAAKFVDLVYLNHVGSKQEVASILKAMKSSGVRRIIVASILGIYDEVPGAFGKWNKMMVGEHRIKQHKEVVELIERPEWDYTVLRLSWLYNQKKPKGYELTSKGEAFKGTQVTREAVAQLIVDIVEDPTNKYRKQSIGVGEPNTNYGKPSFY